MNAAAKYSSQKSAASLILAGGNPPVLLQFGKEVLHQMSPNAKNLYFCFLTLPVLQFGYLDKFPINALRFRINLSIIVQSF
jgi:hypothetical protein